MFFALSKLFWIVLDPSNFVLIVMLTGCLLLYTRRFVLGRRICMFGLGLTILFGVVPLGNYFLNLLEDRFQPVSLPEHVDGIIVLGGVLDMAVTLSRDQQSFNGSSERIVALQGLTDTYRNVPVVFTSGSGFVFQQEFKEAQLIRQTLQKLVVNPGRIVLEDQSRNTYENVLYSKELLNPQPGERWVMVTSASHMPRAMGIFRKQDWQVIPYPVDYKTAQAWDWNSPVKVFKRFEQIRFALHEWLGLLVYRLTDKTDTLLPAQNASVE